VVLVAADPKHGILRLDWKIVEEENSECSADNVNACTPVNIFFDKWVGTRVYLIR
jgi:hypothetical protein